MGRGTRQTVKKRKQLLLTLQTRNNFSEAMSFHVVEKFIVIYTEMLQFLRTSSLPTGVPPLNPAGDFRLSDF